MVANPQAVAFYEAVGFVPSGHADTRFGPAPRMSLRLDGGIDGAGAHEQLLMRKPL